MVFRRRQKRSFLQNVGEFFWPSAGWRRAATYVRHRIHRLPDSPERIARGVWAGVFVSFTPLFGLHFLIAAAIAWLIRGNIIASLIATLVGNPVTFVPIGIVSMNVGYFLRGAEPPGWLIARMPRMFVGAGEDLWDNFLALFGHETMQWGRLHHFYDAVFLPYLIGGLIPGAIVATVFYYLSLTLIRTYQRARRKRSTERSRLAATNTTDGPVAAVDAQAQQAPGAQSTAQSATLAEFGAESGAEASAAPDSPPHPTTRPD